MSSIFRIASESDLPEVWRIFQDAVEYHKTQGIAQWDEIYPDYNTIENDIHNRQMHLLEENGAVLAAVVLNEEQDSQYQIGKWRYTNGKIAVIHRLCVKPAEQHRGLGRKMMQLAEQKLQQQGYASVRLDASTHNPFSCRLYESIGYTKTGEVQFRKGRFNLYEKQLTSRKDANHVYGRK
jgi:ribosomal protein S18 acetylase RimI-like enzyme